MENFSMKELRQELDNIGVDYTACIEKSEMFDLLQNKVPPRSLHLPLTFLHTALLGLDPLTVGWCSEPCGDQEQEQG